MCELLPPLKPCPLEVPKDVAFETTLSRVSRYFDEVNVPRIAKLYNVLKDVLDW